MPVTVKELGGRPIMVGFEPYKGTDYFVMRYTYTDDSGQQKPGKNGINIPAEDIEDALQMLIQAYNEQNGTNMAIMDAEDGTKLDELQEFTKEEAADYERMAHEEDEEE